MKKKILFGIYTLLFSLCTSNIYGAGDGKSPRDYIINQKGSNSNNKHKEKLVGYPFVITEESLGTVKVTMTSTVEVNYITGYKNPNKKKFSEGKTYIVYFGVAKYWKERCLASIHTDNT